jgi:hypothetical protein
MPDTDGGAINLVLRYLRAIERKVDRLIDNNRDLKARVVEAFRIGRDFAARNAQKSGDPFGITQKPRFNCAHRDPQA